MITTEPNAKRKAMRVSVPLTVEIEGETYEARDWSVLGVGVAGIAALQPDAIVPARIGLQLPESTLVLPVQLKFVGRHDGVCGFDFHELSPRTRRVLRHYIEMSLDGSLADAEQLVSAAALPAVPAAGGVMLGTGPDAHLPAHPVRTAAAVLMSLLVVFALAAVLFYNLQYKVEGTGYVGGSMARVTANHSGRIGKLLVQPGTQVEADAPLFVVDNPALRTEVEVLEQHIAKLEAQHAQVVSARRRAEAGLIAAMQRDWAAREAELRNARSLLDRGAITQRDVLLVANDAAGMRQDYLRQISDAATRTQSLDASDALDRLRLELAAKKAQLASLETERSVRSPARGKVFHVDKAAGEFVSPQDAVLLLETDVTPTVLMRLPDDEALKLQPGMPATVYVPFEDRKYKAKVAAVGNAAGGAAMAAQESGLQGTLVRLDFDDRRVRLPANARVNVWIRNLSSLLS